MKRTCEYRTNLDPDFRCTLPALEKSKKGYCILHSEEMQKDRGAFREAVALKINVGHHDFTGCIFPERVHYTEKDFTPGGLFRSAVFAGDVVFERCRFGEQSDFSHCLFKGSLQFISCEVGDMDFRSSEVHGNAEFSDCKVSLGMFTGARFLSGASFWGSTFGSRFSCDSAFFGGKVSFGDTHFLKSAEFSRSEFTGDAEFWDAHFGGDVEMFSSRFYSRLLMHGTRIGMCLFLHGAEVANKEDLWYVTVKAKALFRAQGHPELEAREFLRERRLVMDSLAWTSPRKWWHLALYRLCCYGERPEWLLGWWVTLILVFAGVYVLLGQGLDHGSCFSQRLSSSIYLSVVSFTTLGLGAWKIPVDSSLWIPICLEALLGAFMIALFVMTFGRKLMR